MASFKKILFFIFLFNGALNTLMAQQKEVNDLLLKLKKSRPDTSRLAILSHLSSAYMSVDPELTYTYALDLKKLTLKTGQFKKSADADILLGISWGIRSRYDSSLYYFKQSLIQAENIKYVIGIADAYINIGQVFSRLDDEVKASAYYLKALPLFEKSQYLHGVNLCLTNLGDIYAGQKSYGIALNYYNRSLSNYRGSKNVSGEASVLNSIATCYLKMKDYSRSLATYQLSLKISERIGDLWSEAYICSGMGEVYTALQQYEKASTNLFKAEEYLKKIQDKDLLVAVYQQIAANYLKQDQFGLAERYALKSLTMAQQIKSKTKTANAYRTLSEINEAEGNFKAAYHYQSSYLRYRDAVFSDEKLKKVSLLSLERSQAENVVLTKNNELQAVLLEKKQIADNLL
jgi:tetratricopeptide (TPR) repeat protein